PAGTYGEPDPTRPPAMVEDDFTRRVWDSPVARWPVLERAARRSRSLPHPRRRGPSSERQTPSPPAPPRPEGPVENSPPFQRGVYVPSKFPVAEGGVETGRIRESRVDASIGSTATLRAVPPGRRGRWESGTHR